MFLHLNQHPCSYADAWKTMISFWVYNRNKSEIETICKGITHNNSNRMFEFLMVMNLKKYTDPMQLRANVQKFGDGTKDYIRLYGSFRFKLYREKWERVIVEFVQQHDKFYDLPILKTVVSYEISGLNWIQFIRQCVLRMQIEKITELYKIKNLYFNSIYKLHIFQKNSSFAYQINYKKPLGFVNIFLFIKIINLVKYTFSVQLPVLNLS